MSVVYMHACQGGGGGGGITPRKIRRGCRGCAGLFPKITVNTICEGLLLIFFSIMMKKWLLLKKKHIHIKDIKVRVQTPYPIDDQNG